MRPHNSLPRQRKRSKGRLFAESALACALVIALAGCSGSPKAPAGGAKPAVPPAGGQAAANKPPEQPAAVETKAPTDYAYLPGGRRDPFSPIIEREEKKEKSFAVPPLERYPLLEFKLTGIISGGFGYSAVLEGPDGKGYFIRIGTIIGQNRGKVKKITRDSFVVEESFKNYMGVTERKEITVKLQKKQEGLP